MRKITFKRALALSVWIAAIILMFVACDDKLDIKQTYSFELETMPIPKRILENETAEIRCRITREGNYDGTRFYIRYFQPDGKGELRIDDGTAFLPNDLYPVENMVFRLYYTSRSSDRQVIDVYIEDNTGQVVQKSFSFQNVSTSSGEEGEE